MRTTVLAKLDISEHLDLMELEAAVMALPFEYNSVEMFEIAKKVRLDLYHLKATLIDKYIAPNGTISELEELFGEYGYSFDAEAGVINKDES